MKLPNHLLFKLLLAFWITSSLVLGLVIGLPHLQKSFDREPLDPRLAMVLNRTAERLVETPPQHWKQLSHNLRHYQDERGREFRMSFYLIDKDGRPVFRGDRRLPREVRHFLLELDSYQQPMRYRFPNEVVFGPKEVQLNGETHYLIGKIRAPHQRPWLFFLMAHPGAFLLVAIAFSGLVFGLLAWHLGKPLRHLKDTAGALARGDLEARVDGDTLSRRDELGQLATSFNQMADSVTTMVKGQQRLLSGISHELRTPLTRLQLALALARKKGEDSAELQRIGREAEQLDAMIRELLALSRLNMQITDSKHPLDLIDVLTDVIDDAGFEAEQMNKQLSVTMPEHLPFKGIENLLRRAVENLLRNALRYAENQVSLEIVRQPNEVLIRISDDGPGVPETELETIFKPFYRVAEARDRDSGGWGLGLAITQGAVEAHQGRVRANNRTPHGLTMTVTLPLA
ncbi:ATP-binding protein [Ferrimonas balearica]|uniref:ATP-binding protein n=1 Tax=Ferrimonas balearica TaxID=44012 RepID=UPI001C971A73|nr:HAMP domain-containing protein [Ferrimonas balearica]